MSTQTQNIALSRAITPAEFDFHHERAAALRAAAMSQAVGSLGGMISAFLRGGAQKPPVLRGKLVTAR